MSEEILFERSGDGLATITLNRPDKRNALTPEMFDLIDRHLDTIEAASGRIGAVLLKGAGSCFSAGNDVTRIGKTGPGRQPQVIDRLAALPVPVVAAVHGYCFTGALELALAADLILASGNAQFGDTHAQFGLSPRWGMSQRLPRRVGLSKAREMMFTTRRYDAQAALAMGLADQCFAEGEFADRVAGYLGEILSKSWFSHFHNKRVLNQTDGWDLARGLAHERDTHPGVDPAARERLAAFGKKD